MATVKPAQPFKPEDAAQGLRAAMKGIGTDEDAITKILAHHTNRQRQEIKSTYKTMFGRDLEHDIKSEVGGHYLHAVESALATPAVYDARELHKALKGAGTKESVLIEILASRTNTELAAVKDAYKLEFGETLEEALQSDTSGEFLHLLVSLCNSHRDESQAVDSHKAKEDASKLFEAGEKKWGTDESAFNQVLCLRSLPELAATFKAYAELAGHDIEDAIRSETSGTLQDGYLAIVKCAKSRADYFAERLYDAMKGAGTSDDQMIRVIISRSEIDLENIKRAFLKYESDLRSFVEGECSGDYRNFLLAFIN